MEYNEMKQHPGYSLLDDVRNELGLEQSNTIEAWQEIAITLADKIEASHTIFCVVEEYSRKGCHEGSGEFTVYSSREMAQKHLKERWRYEKEGGLIYDYHDPDDPGDDWTFDESEDSYYAHDENYKIWLHYYIVDKEIVCSRDFR
jgi:hypothetical protein